MHIISSHDHNIYLEMAITTLEERGISKEHILALPLEKKEQEMAIFDTIHRSDGISNIDGAFALGAPMMVLGVIYGFVWHWGPIIWALIGLITGSVCGLFLKIFLNRKHRRKWVESRRTEVVLIIRCPKEQAALVEKILWEHNALGVAKYAGPAADCQYKY